ncbi:TPA: hypothetical protein HA251_06265 [Candidatus Woesearchaeota archaeon]|nr:hypothetical protein [Candidatus Woesearchaeota archaeon]
MERIATPKRSFAARILGRETAEEICTKIDNEAREGLGFVVQTEGGTSSLVRPQQQTERRLDYEAQRMTNGAMLCTVFATAFLGAGAYLATEKEPRIASTCVIAGVGLAAGSRHYATWAAHYYDAYTRIRRENNI